MKLQPLYYASSLVLIFGVHLNATVVAFMTASPAQPLPTHAAWHWAQRVLAFPLEWALSPASLPGVIVVAIFNSALWALALTHLGRWLLRRRGGAASKATENRVGNTAVIAAKNTAKNTDESPPESAAQHPPGAHR